MTEVTASTWTFTFSESVENHAGMQVLGRRASSGFLVDELKAAQTAAEAMGCTTELIDLKPALSNGIETTKSAFVLVIRNYTQTLLKSEASAFNTERDGLKTIVDKKAYMYGRVVNKHARWNLCFDDQTQEPDYEKKQGRVVAFSTVPYLSRIRANIETVFGTKAKNLKAELNYYYDTRKCGIGWHGDSERRIVIGVRSGATMNLNFHWFHHGVPVGSITTLSLNDGDAYAMSDTAVGHDWHLKSTPTLRHSAGCLKVTQLPKPTSNVLKRKRVSVPMKKDDKPPATAASASAAAADEKLPATAADAAGFAPK